jgi:CheY-like chemotaxis protein
MGTAAAHVLVVDDAPELRTLFRDILEDAGYRVSLADAAPSIEEISQLQPNAILLDLLLGTDEMAAWGLVEDLGRTPGLCAIPIVVCSAATHLLRQLEPDLRAAGATFVPKPFALDDLLNAVARALHPDDES